MDGLAKTRYSRPRVILSRGSFHENDENVSGQTSQYLNRTSLCNRLFFLQLIIRNRIGLFYAKVPPCGVSQLFTTLSPLMNSQKLVIPAQAGIQSMLNRLKTLDSRFHGNDGIEAK
jgi:hypothetical protein